MEIVVQTISLIVLASILVWAVVLSKQLLDHTWITARSLPKYLIYFENLHLIAASDPSA